MKATIDVPDELYRRVKAKSALEGRAVREVTIELYRRWLGEVPASPSEKSPQQLLEDWLEVADRAIKNAPAGPSAREILEEDRNRLERGQ